MVKGISRQVIVVHSPDPKLFEQAIFILKDDVIGGGVTEETLLREAKRLINDPTARRKRRLSAYGLVWACGGAIITGILWMLSALL